MFPWMVHLKCTPPGSGVGSLVMRMLERHLTEVVNDNARYSFFSDLQTSSSVYKFCVIGGIFLHWFTDSMLFSTMLKTGYEDGVETIQDLIDRDMSLGRIKRKSLLKSVGISLFSVLWAHLQWKVDEMKRLDDPSYKILGMIYILLIFH